MPPSVRCKLRACRWEIQGAICRWPVCDRRPEGRTSPHYLHAVRPGAVSRQRSRAGRKTRCHASRQSSTNRVPLAVGIGGSDHPSITAIYAALARDEVRNDLIFDDVLNALEAKRFPLVLNERRDHLEYLQNRFSRFVRNLVVLRGGMSAAERGAVEIKIGILGGEERLILSTGRYIGEGFGRPETRHAFLDNAHFMEGHAGTVRGRLHRQWEEKTDVLVVDYVDQYVPLLTRMAAKRRAGYRTLGYRIE